MRFLEQLYQGLKNGKTVEDRLASCRVGKAPWSAGEQRMILARLQHPLEDVCMCEGWITQALPGGGIKRGFSIILQTPKFHEGKICTSQIKPEHLQGKD